MYLAKQQVNLKEESQEMKDSEKSFYTNICKQTPTFDRPF